MSKKEQVSKNVYLSQKLAEFFANHPDKLDDLPKGASYVTFSKSDKKLNAMNTRVVNKLIKEGRPVIKAEETKNKDNPFILVQI